MMNTFKDAIVTTEQYKFIKQGIVNAARMSLSARNLIGIRRPPLGLGVQTFSHDELTEMGTAMLSYNFVEQLEGTNLTRTNTNIPIHQEDFFIGERDLLASQRTGVPLPTQAVDVATYSVAKSENELILVGSTAGSPGPAVNGLYNSAGNDFSTTADFATFGKPTTAVEGAMALLLADNIEPPYHLVLNPTQYAQLKGSISSTGIHEMPIVQDMLNDMGGGGQVWTSSHMAAGTGMMLPVNGAQKGFFEYVLAHDLDSVLSRKSIADQGGLKGKVFVAGVPIIYDSNAICKLSVI
jgi:uncharacterized linocin/CFP29 family protein